MFIIEGLDNTGKTTIVTKILDEFPQLDYRPSIGNKHDPAQIHKAAEEEAFRARPILVSDRSRIISEYIYTPILGGRDLAYDPVEYGRLLHNFAQRPHTIVWVQRPISEVMSSFDEREQLSGVRANISKLNAAYRHVFEWLTFLYRVSGQDPRKRIKHWSYSMGDEKMFKFVRQYLEEVDS